MRYFKITFFLLLLFSHKLFADEIKQFIFENDFIAGTDKDYTNGIYYTWLNDENIYIPSILDFGTSKKSKAITLSHMMFTPEDLSTSDKIDTDIPYAGYLGIDYKTFQYDKNFFHELGVSFGFTGKYTYAKELQTAIHKVTENEIPQGWDNQLATHLFPGIGYQFGAKTNKYDLEYFELDMTASAKFTLSEMYTGSRLNWGIRIGNRLRDNFQTSGDFLGGLESSLLNFNSTKGFYWVLGYGGFANKINHFYIMENTNNYYVDTINYVSGDIFSYSIGYNNIDLTFHMKTNYANSFHRNTFGTRYGGFIVTWEF